MVIAATVNIKDIVDLEQGLKKLSGNLDISINDASLIYGDFVVKSFKRSVVNDTIKSPDRFKAAQKIRARKRSKNIVDVLVPQSLKSLDSITPQFIELKRGRKITRWARKHFIDSRVRITGKSKVKQGPRGGLTGKIWVTPHPWIDRGLKNVRNRLQPELRRGLRKAFRKSRIGGT